MPEGDTIYRTAARLRPVLQDTVIETAHSRDQVLAADSLNGLMVTSVEARGKHLLMHVSDGRCIHSHMGMHGSWHLYQRDEPWRKPERLSALVLETAAHSVVCFNPKLLEVLTRDGLKRHRWLSRLGPDLLAGTLDESEVLRRFRTQTAVAIGEALLNQSVVCGIGNVFKSEVLFLTATHPTTPVTRLDDQQVLKIVREAQRLMLRNLDSHPRRTRFGPGRQPHWVYARAGEPCLRCDTRIKITRQGDLGRTTYWCPDCQPPAADQALIQSSP